MDLNDDAWTVVKNTPGVTGFVGAGSKPVPLSQGEVDRILHTGAATASACARRSSSRSASR
jgi:transcriptional antiterminator NusG